MPFTREDIEQEFAEAAGTHQFINWSSNPSGFMHLVGGKQSKKAWRLANPKKSRTYDRARYDREKEQRVIDAREYYWTGGGRELKAKRWAERNRGKPSPRKAYRLDDNELLTISVLQQLSVSGYETAKLLQLSRACVCRKRKELRGRV